MSSEKPWDRPWSMEEMIENSDKWSLAGDVALLNTLKSFADSLLSRTTEINDNLNSLTKNLDDTSLQLDIAKNQFQSLRNTQFIESRVYEDDETLPQPENPQKVDPQSEPDRTEAIRQAALKGLDVLDRYFDKVEVNVSDSEDEDEDLPNYVLRPKDLYIDRPLPYVIGSEEWYKSWHVGLEDSSSDSETEKVSDKFSESDSESDLPIIQDRSQIKGTSDTSSEFDFSQKTDNGKHISSKQDLFHSSDSEENSVPISNKNFAEELAAKLGNVISQEFVESEVNKKPIQKNKSQYGDVFFDEPPPLDESKGLFSGGSGLFDDDDDIHYSTPADSKIEESPKISKKSGAGLFDEESSDDDIFNPKKSPAKSNKAPVFVEEPPVLDGKKKPVGGVSIFGGANLFDKKLLRRQPSSDEDTESSKETNNDNKTTKKVDLFNDDDLFKSVSNEEKLVTETKSVPVKKINLFESDEEESKNEKNDIFYEDTNEKKNPVSLFDDNNVIKKQENLIKDDKKISLFDDDDELFKDDIFSKSSKKKFTSNLFDDIQSDDNLFSEEVNEKLKPSINLFEDLMNIPDSKNSINLQSQVSPEQEVLAQSETDDSQTFKDNNLFESVPEPKNRFFEELKDGDSITSELEAPKPKPRLSLFDSPPPETDDLFSGEIFPKKDAADEPTTSTTINSSTVVDSQEFSENVENESTKKSLPTSIFDSELGDDHDDLFGIIKPSANISEHSKEPSLFSTSFRENDDDIFADKTSKEQSETVVSDPVKVLPNMRLFDPNPPPDDEWETKSDNLSDENESFTDQEEVAPLKSSLFNEEPPSLDFSENKDSSSSSVSITTEKFQNESKQDIKPNLNSPGKLKHNLNINVKALMPGSLRPKLADLKQRSSVEKSKDEEENKTFDTTDNVEVLHSITKDRAKVPLHRRPSTRRGRKAALKNVVSDFKLEDNSELPQSKAEEELSSSSNSLVDSLKSDDLFDVKSEIRSKPGLKTDLFDDDDNNDMFTTKKVPVQKIKKKSLFDDDSDDDDIFKSATSEVVSKNPEIKVAVEKKIPKMTAIKKLENTKPDDDPLSAFLK